MTQQEKTQDAKSDDLNSFPRTHTVEENNWLMKAALWPHVPWSMHPLPHHTHSRHKQWCSFKFFSRYSWGRRVFPVVTLNSYGEWTDSRHMRFCKGSFSLFHFSLGYTEDTTLIFLFSFSPASCCPVLSLRHASLWLCVCVCTFICNSALDVQEKPEFFPLAFELGVLVQEIVTVNTACH